MGEEGAERPITAVWVRPRLRPGEQHILAFRGAEFVQRQCHVEQQPPLRPSVFADGGEDVAEVEAADVEGRRKGRLRGTRRSACPMLGRGPRRLRRGATRAGCAFFRSRISAYLLRGLPVRWARRCTARRRWDGGALCGRLRLGDCGTLCVCAPAHPNVDAQASKACAARPGHRTDCTWRRIGDFL